MGSKEEILSSLNDIEGNIVDIVKIASEAVSHVSCKDASSDNSEQFQKKSSEFLEMTKKVHSKLVSHSSIVSNYRNYGKSTYGNERRVQLIREQVRHIVSLLE